MTVHRLNGTTIAPFIPGLVDLYAIVYAEPPYEEGPEQVEEFRTKLPTEATRAGFAAVIQTEGAAVVAAAYGWTMPAGTWWSRADTEPPVELRNADKLAVMEWIVHPGRRGEGRGALVLQELLDDRQEPWATLASDPRSAARAIYERIGWEQVGTSTLPWGPKMDLLARPLRRTG